MTNKDLLNVLHKNLINWRMDFELLTYTVKFDEYKMDKLCEYLKELENVFYSLKKDFLDAEKKESHKQLIKEIKKIQEANSNE